MRCIKEVKVMAKPNINYQIEMENILKSLEHREKLLLHSCCGPCSTAVIERLVKYFDITVYYYNPCTAPYEEYEKRKAEQIKVIESWRENGINIDYAESGYFHDDFLLLTSGRENDREGGYRCRLCYEQRLRGTAEYAKGHGFMWFCSTLTVSPYKNATILNELGSAIAKENGLKYLLSDFKKKEGYKRSIVLSGDLNLYRQEYCGCEYSLRDATLKGNG